MNIDTLVEILHHECLSCVVGSPDGTVTRCHRRGVIDLYELLTQQPWLLDGASIADKVVGRGAAALMALGRVARLHTDVVSRLALQMLAQGGVEVTYGTLADNIINRAGTDICPVEKLTQQAATPQEALPLIEQFIKQNNNK